jgi:hypothetical protein
MGRKFAVQPRRVARLNNRRGANVREFSMKFKRVSKKHVDNRRNVLQRLILAERDSRARRLSSAAAMR